jgi:hypothetical protein
MATPIIPMAFRGGSATVLSGFLLLAAWPQPHLFAQRPPPEAKTQPNEVTPPDESLAFLTRRAVLWTGRSQIIPVQMKDDAPVEDDLVFPVKATDASVVEILRPATVLAHEKLGFLRLRARGRCSR